MADPAPRKEIDRFKSYLFRFLRYLFAVAIGIVVLQYLDFSIPKLIHRVQDNSTIDDPIYLNKSEEEIRKLGVVNEELRIEEYQVSQFKGQQHFGVRRTPLPQDGSEVVRKRTYWLKDGGMLRVYYTQQGDKWVSYHATFVPPGVIIG